MPKELQTETVFAFTAKDAAQARIMADRASDILARAVERTGGDPGRDLTNAERIVWINFVEARTKMDIASRNLLAILNQ